MQYKKGDELVRRMRQFTRALNDGDATGFTARTITMNLKPTSYTPEQVKAARKSLCLSQPLFAQFLGVSLKTVRAWEQGHEVPRDVACRFMDEIRRKPDYFRERVIESIAFKDPTCI